MWTYFNPLPPHGGRHNKLVVAVVGQGFQSTPSAWRETVSSYRITQSPVPFQSTPSAWRETSSKIGWRGLAKISIHSLRMEGDSNRTVTEQRKGYFNPLPPHGGRQKVTSSANDTKAFQSTPSAWRETYLKRQIESKQLFQSTPSAWRETVLLAMICTISSYFNPLPPHGGRRVIHFSDRFACHISIHSLRMEGDAQRSSHTPDRRYFNPLPPHGGRRILFILTSQYVGNFNPLPPHGGRRDCFWNQPKYIPISIHSLRMEGDQFEGFLEAHGKYFNPLPPHGGRRQIF